MGSFHYFSKLWENFCDFLQKTEKSLRAISLVKSRQSLIVKSLLKNLHFVPVLCINFFTILNSRKAKGAKVFRKYIILHHIVCDFDIE